MSKEYYCRQKFLFEMNCKNLNVSNYYCTKPDFLQNYTEPINLFDDDNISRYVNIAELDSDFDSRKDFEEFISAIKHVDILYIINTRKTVNNPIISKIQLNSLVSYITYFENAGKICKVVNNNKSDCLN